MIKSLDQLVNSVASNRQTSDSERPSTGYNVPLIEDPTPFEGEETIVDGEHYWEVNGGSNKRIYLNGEEEIIIFPESNDKHVTDIWEHNIQKWEENSVPVLADFETDYVVVDGEEKHYGKTQYKENTSYSRLDEEMQERFADDFIDIITTYDFLHRDEQISYAEQPIQWEKFLDNISVAGPVLETPEMDSSSVLYSDLDDSELEQELQHKLSEAVYKGWEEVPQDGRIYFDEDVYPQETAEALEPELLLDNVKVDIANDVVYDHEEDHLAISDYGEPAYMNGEYSLTTAGEFLEGQGSRRSALSD